jgi:hypothetical protein
MRPHRRRLPSLVAALALTLVASPAWPGGRDVPDSSGSSQQTRVEPPKPTDASSFCPARTATTPVLLGGLAFEVGVEAGQPVFRPLFVGAVERLATRLTRAWTGSPSSCPSD